MTPVGPLQRRAMPAAAGGADRGALRCRTADPDPARGVDRAGSWSAVRRAALAAIVPMAVAALALVVAPALHAEEVFTSQAAQARATDSTWIPAPTQRAALCVVDTGAGSAQTTNPDLGNVVARFAVDGGAPDDLNDDHHGTLMTMIAAAPYNGFGMVGAAPSINIVSVRASRDGATFGSADLTTAIQKCVMYRTAYNIKVVTLSLGAAVTTGLDLASVGATENAVDNARRAGLDVVAAAGNHPGAVDWPAGYGPVLAVGAADDAGAVCPFAASGPEVDLWTSGCPQDVAVPDGRAAWASGSSEATAFVAGALTELRGLRPDLTIDEAEGLLTANASSRAAGPSLDTDAAFRAAGLAGALASGHAAIPRPPTAAPSGATTTTQPTTSAPEPSTADPALQPSPSPGLELPPAVAAVPVRSALPRPSVRSVGFRHGLLTLRFNGKPKGTVARVEIYARKGGRAFPTLARRLLVTGDRLRTRVSGTLSEVSITYRDPTGIRRESVPLSLHPRT